MRAGVIAGCLAPRKWPAVVARHDDDGIVELTRSIDSRDSRCRVPIVPLHLPEVIADVAADDFVVREIRRYTHILQTHPALYARARFVRAVRIGASEPETKRRIGFSRGQKIFKALKFRPGRISFPPAWLECPWRPTLPG